jgi:hypothetical protein
MFSAKMCTTGPGQASGAIRAAERALSLVQMLDDDEIFDTLMAECLAGKFEKLNKREPEDDSSMTRKLHKTNAPGLDDELARAIKASEPFNTPQAIAEEYRQAAVNHPRLLAFLDEDQMQLD